jgi:hypothetical protein
MGDDQHDGAGMSQKGMRKGIVALCAVTCAVLSAAAAPAATISLPSGLTVQGIGAQAQLAVTVDAADGIEAADLVPTTPPWSASAPPRSRP